MLLVRHDDPEALYERLPGAEVRVMEDQLPEQAPPATPPPTVCGKCGSRALYLDADDGRSCWACGWCWYATAPLPLVGEARGEKRVIRSEAEERAHRYAIGKRYRARKAADLR